MGKVDEILQTAGAYIEESMGADKLKPPERDRPPARPAAPDRNDGLGRLAGGATIPVDRIVRDEAQPREDFDPEALARLAESLKARGQLQPIRVRWDEGRGVYVLVVGERRWRAAALAGLPTVAAIVHEGPVDPAELLALQLVENALREDLKPIEQARAYRRLMDAHGWSGVRLAEELRIAQPSVVRALALLEAPAPVRELVEAEQLPPSVAYEISKVPDRDDQAELARRAVAEDMTRAEVVAEVRRAGGYRGRGRGGRKATARTFRLAGGYRLDVGCKRGVEPAGIAAALRAALAIVEAETAAAA
jgi:ParB family chromosome partitioning protein